MKECETTMNPITIKMYASTDTGASGMPDMSGMGGMPDMGGMGGMPDMGGMGGMEMPKTDNVEEN